MKWFLLFLILILSACVPNSKSFPVSVFAGSFPQDPQSGDLPIWKASLEALEPVALKAVQDFDGRFPEAFISDLTDAAEAEKGLKVHEILDLGITKNQVKITLTQTTGHVALGVFDLRIESSNVPGFNSLADNLYRTLVRVLDAQFPRDRI
jgi:hypothetical protein